MLKLKNEALQLFLGRGIWKHEKILPMFIPGFQTPEASLVYLIFLNKFEWLNKENSIRSKS